MAPLPCLFVEENEAHANVSSSVHSNSVSSQASSTTGGSNGESTSGSSTGALRRARLMKMLHNLHRLAWARRQADSEMLLQDSPELAAADLMSRTDAVSVYYSGVKWEQVASTAPPLSHQVRS